METILTFLETTSLLRPLYVIAQMSHTELVVAFLVSKPLFIATAALLVNSRSLRGTARRLLATSHTDPNRLLEDG